MSTKTRTLAKSLHTVTVLHRVASHLVNMGECARDNPGYAVDVAATILGYTGADDPYGLRFATIALLEKGIADTLSVYRPGPTDAELRAEQEAWEEREDRRLDHSIDHHF